MSNKAILIRTGGVATAILAHAAFVYALVAPQPRPAQYLTRLAPAPAAAPAEVPAGVKLARRDPAELPVVSTLTPTRLLRGTIAC